MKSKSLSFMMSAALLATSCANEEVVEFNPDPSGNAITFNPQVGRTRATETTISNLGNFSVLAKCVHPQGTLYNSWLIADQTDPNNPIGEIAEKSSMSADNTSGIWTLDRNVYWPEGVADVMFWAYTDSSEDGKLSNGKISFESNGPKISGFEPKTIDLNASSDNTVLADGQSQKELLVAFAHHDDNNTGINLTFDHALSQIDITAESKNKPTSDNRIVKIKGAWIMNVSTKGNLSAGYKWENGKGSSTPSWGDLSGNGKYGTFHATQTEISNSSKSVLGNGGNLMIIPQTKSKWDEKESGSGTYILLLCRVELKHSGENHEGEDIADVNVPGDGNHYHQQFPVTDKFNSEEYGFSCVAVPVDWEMGKKYVYALDICGAASGAGVYPPQLSDDVINSLIPSSMERKYIITTRPDGKNVGDPVLDEPIKFNVKVSNWETGNTWINGTESKATESTTTD
ncbi:MAG: fimbrillin family protein [Muribaculaceae bacterium]|nr:fimbrillin family protein [Muribaculaceae bacterium]